MGTSNNKIPNTCGRQTRSIQMSDTSRQDARYAAIRAPTVPTSSSTLRLSREAEADTAGGNFAFVRRERSYILRHINISRTAWRRCRERHARLFSE